MSTQASFCPYCGKPLELELDYEAAFCPYCGKKIEMPAPPEKPQTEPVPAPAPRTPRAEEPVLEQKTPAAPARAAAAPTRRAATMRRFEARTPATVGKWILSVVVWAFAFGLVYFAGEELDILDQPSIFFPLLLLASFPIWYPRFHPRRKDPEKRKGVWLRWSLIMAAILAAIIFLVEEVL